MAFRPHRSHLMRLAGLLAASLALLAARAGATTVVETPFPMLVETAEVIAVGTVTAIETEWDAQHGAPFTLVTFSDLEVLKGQVGQPTLTLEFLGGPEPDGTILEIVGTPAFRVGERSVVFSAGNGYDAVPLVGMWQGVYRVVFDAERGVDTIHDHAGQPVSALLRSPASVDGLLVYEDVRRGRKDGALSRGQSPPAGAARQDAMPLATFTSLIERELRQR